MLSAVIYQFIDKMCTRFYVGGTNFWSLASNVDRFFVSGDILMLELMYLSNWIQLARLSLLKLPITF